MVCPIISGEETQGCNGRGDAGGSQRADQSCIFHSRNQLVGMLSLRDQRLAARLAVPSPIPISIAIAAHERPSERRLLILVRLTLTRGRPNCLPFGLSIPQSCPYPLSDQTPLQLGHSTQNGEDHPPCGCAGVHLFRKRNKLDPQTS